MKLYGADYRVIRTYTFSLGSYETKEIDKGTLVSTVEDRYLPKHTREKWPYFNKDTEIFCQTKHGLVPIPRTFLERI